MMAAEPLLFISHKHSDREIAEKLARFVRERTAGKVRVHLSSSPNFEGPRLGQPLNHELKSALAQADAVILVFTTDAEDWSYCMWEVGVATDPRDEHKTSVVVIQCTEDEPKPYGDQLRVDARDVDSIHTFVKQLLTTKDIFLNRPEPVTGFSGDGLEISQYAAELHGDLASLLPVGGGPQLSMPASPYLRIHLSDAAANELRTHYLEGATQQCLELIEQQAMVVDEALGAENLLGMAIGPKTTLGDVLASWRQDNKADADEPRWFWALAEQMETALGGKVRPVKWAPFRSNLGRSDVPYVAATRKVATGVDFDLYLVPFAPRPIPVKERMVTLDQMYFKDDAVAPLDEVLLMTLLDEMNKRPVTRLPVLHAGAPLSIVHKATIHEFIVEAITVRKVDELTLQDLLSDHAEALEGSYAEVAPNATMEEAIEAMAAKPGCQDVFVVKEGRVVGWLPNVAFIQDAQS